MLQASHGVEDKVAANAPIAVDEQLVGDSGMGCGCAGGAGEEHRAAFFGSRRVVGTYTPGKASNWWVYTSGGWRIQTENPNNLEGKSNNNELMEKTDWGDARLETGRDCTLIAMHMYTSGGWRIRTISEENQTTIN